MRYDIAIIGAGVAGLVAARSLATAGLRVALLEARQRVGGRIWTARGGEAATDDAPLPIELGAEFVHGLPPETWTLIREAELEVRERSGAFLCTAGGPLQRHDEQREGGMAVLEAMLRWQAQQPPGRDLSFADYLQLAGVAGLARQRVMQYVEGFNAADASIVGVAWLAAQQRAEDRIESDRAFYLCRGYDRLPDYLLRESQQAGVTLLLDHTVRAIDWRPGAVSIAGGHENAEPFDLRADRALISVPLGVLLGGAIGIAPAPGAVLVQAGRLRMGEALRLTLIFRERFWADGASLATFLPLAAELQDLSFLLVHGGLPSAWWTPMPDPRPMITAWLGGPAVAAVRAGGGHDWRAALLQRSLATLGQALGRSVDELRPLLVSSHLHDWQADPYSMGAYSYAPVGALDASSKMCEPVAATLFFAGEHTDTTGHWGTVHGALNSGMRAARQVLQTGPGRDRIEPS